MSSEGITWISKVPKKEISAFHHSVCLEHRLFLNYAKGTADRHFCQNDDFFPLHFTHKIKDIKTPYHFFSYLVEIKDSYVVARTLFIKAQIADTAFEFLKIPYEDRLNPFTDYRVGFDLNIETMKLSLTKSYSVFDKIAFLVHEYLDGSLAEWKIDFKSIFKTEKLHFKENNKYLFALNDIRLDLEEFDSRINRIRNSIEHKYLVVHTLFEPHQITFPLSADKPLVKDPHGEHSRENPINFHTTDGELFDLTLKTLKLARSALLYLTFFISEREQAGEEKGNFYVTDIDNMDRPAPFRSIVG